MLAAWYFCSCLGLTIRQSADYLDIVEILRSKKSRPDHLAAAVEKLVECEPALRLHGLVHVLTAPRRADFGPDALSAAARLCDGLAEWAAPAEPEARQALGGLLKEALAASRERGFVERVEEVLRGCRPRAAAATEAVPYQDPGATVRETLALTLLVAAVPEGAADVAALCVDQDRPDVVTQALANRLGRLPLLLAVDAALASSHEEMGDMVRGVLQRAGRGSADLEPDLLAALARSWFPPSSAEQDVLGTTDREVWNPPDPEALAERFENELGTGLLLRSWAGRGGGARARRSTRGEVLARLGCESDRIAPERVTTALWQLSLWEAFAEHDPVRALESAARWWGAPAKHQKRTLPQGELAVLASMLATDSERQTAVEWIGTMTRGGFPRRAEPQVTGRDDPDGVPPYAVCSPWVWRGHNRFSLARHEEDTWYDGWDDLDVLRMTALAPVAVRLLREAEAPDSRSSLTDPAVAFLFHAKDVFTDPRHRHFLDALRTESYPKNLTVRPPLAALVQHAHLTVGRAGRGLYPEIPASRFADFLVGGPGDTGGTLDEGQWNRLFSRPALNAARDWINDSASGARRDGDDGRNGVGWFDGGVPPARRVLTAAVGRLLPLDRHEDAKNLKKAEEKGSTAPRTYTSSTPFLMSLAGDFSLDLVPAARDEIDRDWMTPSRLEQLLANYRHRREISERNNRTARPGLIPETLLVADRYPVQQWRKYQEAIAELVPDPYDPQHWGRSRETFDGFLVTMGASPLTLQTLRLAALLEADSLADVPESEEWFSSWRRMMDAITHRKHLGRGIRRVALEMFRTPDHGVDAQDRVTGVLERVVDNIVAFSAEAPRYYQLLLSEEALRPGPQSVNPLPAEGMNRLRKRAVEAVRRRQWHADRTLEPTTGPWQVIEQRRARAQIDAEVRAFVAASADISLTSDPGQTLGQVFVRAWEQHALSPEQQPGDAQSDPRLVVSKGLRHRTGEPWHGLAPWRLRPTPAGQAADRPTDLVPLSPSERRDLLAAWRVNPVQRPVLGMVAARDDALGGVQINWGGGSPVTAEDRGRLRVGDPCVVHVLWDEGDQIWRQARGDTAVPTGRADPVDGEVRAARVTYDAGRPRVVVDGVAGDVLHGDPVAAARWEPDLSQMVPGRTVPSSHVPSETLARRDTATGCWLPVDRSLTELVANDLPYRTPEDRPAGVLVYAGEGEPDGWGQHGTRRFSTVAGRTYLLRADDWQDPEALATALVPPRRGAHAAGLDEAQAAEQEPAPVPGMLVYVALGGGADRRLTLLQDPPEGAQARWPGLALGTCRDTRNPDWLGLFDEPESRPWRATIDSGEHGDTQAPGTTPLWRVRVDDVTGYPAGAGFPSSVVVTGLEEGEGTERVFRPRPWDERAARAATVTGDLVRVEFVEDADRPPTGARFDEFWRVERDDVFPVRSLGRSGSRGPTIPARAGAGFPVRLDRSGLVLEETQVAGLMVKVEWVGPAPARPDRDVVPLPEKELAARAGEDAFPLGEAEGVVVRLAGPADGAIASYGVWLRSPGEQPQLCTLPATAFLTEVTDIGTTFRGTRAQDGWLFTPRQVSGTPLYQLSEAPTEPGDPWRFQALVRRPGHPDLALYTRGHAGDVLMAPPPARPSRAARITVHTALGARSVGAGEVSLSFVLARLGASHVVGTLPVHVTGKSAVTGKAVVTGAYFVLTSDGRPAEGAGGTGLIGFRRCFDVSAGTRSAPRNTSPRPRTREDLWRLAFEEGRPRTESGEIRNGMLHVAGHAIPLLPGDAPLVRAVRYPHEDVRARIVVEDGVLMASSAQVPSLDAAGFAQYLAETASARGGRTYRLSHLHYVKADRQGGETRYLFEWGRGHTVLLRAAELTCGGRPCGEPFPLYHGDRLAAVRVHPASGSSGVTLDFRRDDIRIQSGTRVYGEARDDRLVHQITLFADPRTGVVRVRRVRLTPRYGTRAEESFQDAPIAAHLTRADQEKVLRLLGDSAAATELSVLARFDQREYERSEGKRRTFRYEEPGFVGAGDSGDQIFMVAVGIARDADGTYLTLRLPDSVRQADGTDLAVRVDAPDFSVRPNLLDRIYDETRSAGVDDGAGLGYEGAVFLVEVRQGETPGSWLGRLTSVPPREAGALVSAVRHAGGSLLAVVADSQGSKVEVVPGVVFELPEESRKHASRVGVGAVVRLSARAGRGLHVGLAQRADRDYLPGGGRGRAALVGKTGGGRNDTGESLRADGLPALSVRAATQLTNRLRRSDLPQIARLAPHRAGAGETVASSPSGVRAARVDTRGTTPFMRPVPLGATGAPEEGPIPWSRLSFADGTAEDIAARCRDGRRYDDLETGATRRARWQAPSFFDVDDNGDWTLRYRREGLLRNFALPPTALTEAVRPVGPAWYTVAGPARYASGTAYGLWLELAPGRVVEVSGHLVTGPHGHPLADLAWDRFGPGDQVRLDVVQGASAAPRELRLLDWRPGPRAAWSAAADRRVWLPVRPVSEGNGVELGAGHFRCRYPLSDATSCFAPGGLLHAAAAAVLDCSTNTLVAAPDTGPAAGDCALLGLGPDGAPTLLGLEHRRVELSEAPEGWPGGDWLRSLLVRRPATVLGRLGSLPVTVERWSERSVTVSRRLQPEGTLHDRAIMLCTGLIEIDGDLLVRCGGALHRLSPSETIPGLPDELTTEAALFLSDPVQPRKGEDAQGGRLWCRTHAPGVPDGETTIGLVLRVGLSVSGAPALRDEPLVTPRGVLAPPHGPPHGLLVEDDQDHRWHWLPAERASWLPDPTAGELRTALVDHGRSLRVRCMPDGTVSVVDVREVERTRLGLRPGSRIRVEAAGHRESAGKGPRAAVARVLPTGVLVQLRPEAYDETNDRKKGRRGSGGGQQHTLLYCEVERMDVEPGRCAVHVVRVGARRLRVDLPKRLAQVSATTVAAEQTSLATRYADTPLVSTAVLLSQAPDMPLSPEARQELRRWLTDHGEAAYHLRPDPETPGTCPDLELTDTLAALLMMERHGRGSALHAQGAVLLAHHLGLRATRSLHVEPLVRTWASHERLQADARLRVLQFSAEMTDKQLAEARAFGNGLLGQTDGRAGAHPDAPVARAVLAAVGELPPGEDLTEGAMVLSSLAALGRALHPPEGEATAQSELTAGQRNLLWISLRKTLSVPIPLLAHAATSSETQLRLARMVLEEGVEQVH
ncbi:hypothetical protein ACF09C_07225 [Streptomyces sp. NPDC014870]|uniref:hypothetical protein n=1 Tax=Streptomyces sp. NPDC014870 TaxID=3364925 RepID=UPI0037008ED1